MNALRLALDAVVTTENEYSSRCLVVWRELKAADPVLAKEILQLGFDEPTAAQWVCTPFRGIGNSPAAMVAAGHRTKVMDAVHRTAHGFVG